MVRDQAIPALPAGCDTTALSRNVDLGRNYKITGTPTLVFVDGNRVPGAIDSKQVEKLLTDSKS
jgi:thiol:disulfide interchange protein DsbC